MLWYWRINDVIANQERQIALMKNQNDLLARLVGSKSEAQNIVITDSKEEIERKARLYDEANRGG